MRADIFITCPWLQSGAGGAGSGVIVLLCSGLSVVDVEVIGDILTPPASIVLIVVGGKVFFWQHNACTKQ